MPVSAELQKLNQPSPFVELFQLDCTGIGGLLYHFTSHPSPTGSITFGGNTYLSFPIMTDGWEVSMSGTQPRPTLAVANVTKTLLNAVLSLGDLVGAKVTRMRTYEKFLDGEPTADAGAHLPAEKYFIEQKISHTNELITWQLASPIDRFGLMLPKRQILRDKGFPGAGRYRGAF